MGGQEPEATPRPAAEEAWIRDFIAQAEAGHASLTMQLISACLLQQEQGGHQQAAAAAFDFHSHLQLGALCTRLGSGSTVARNRTLRQWLGDHREQVVSHWHELGFPAPASVMPTPPAAAMASGGGAAAAAAADQQLNLVGGVGGPRGVVVFDFDATLSTCQVGWQHIEVSYARVSRQPSL